MSNVSHRPQIFDTAEFRRVLGHFPTGVTVITAAADCLAGMVVGSFCSLSLDPPLVLFSPAKTSTSWPLIRAAGRFCVNVLADDQADLCSAFATPGGDKFAGVDWYPAPSGAPALAGAVAWIDAEIQTEIEMGDHFIVVGQVTSLSAAAADKPLIFFQGRLRSLEQPRELVGALTTHRVAFCAPWEADL